ncbi:zinc ribbon domain-containing protein [[Eubacterium] cellulosolvens]
MGIVIKQSKKRFIQSQKAMFTTLLIITILAASSVSVNAYTIGGYWLCKDVDESSYPHKPIEPTTVFYDTDERVCFLFILEYVTTSHNLIIEMYDPENNLFYTEQDLIPDPRSEGYDSWTDYSYYHYLVVKGDDAADMPGQWRIEIYIDGKKEFVENFEIRSTTPATTTTATTTPTVTPTTSSPPPAPPPRRIEPHEEMQIINSTTTQQEEKIEQPNFLSNPMYLIMIILAVIVVIIFIFLAKRKKPITPQQMEISNKYCMKCGEPLEAEETFCGSCGKKVK